MNRNCRLLGALLLHARRHHGSIDPYRLHRLLSFSGSVIDRIRYLQTLSHSAKGRELPIQMMTVAHQDKEVRGCAIRFFRAGHGNDSTNVLHETRLVGKLTAGASGQLKTPPLAGGKIATL